MIYRKLDINSDYTMGLGSHGFHRDIDATAQAIKTRLLHLQGEWWEDLDEGLPFFQEIAGKRGTQRNMEVADMFIAERINNTPGVNAVESIETKLIGRRFTPRYSVDTIYGQIEDTAVIY